MAGDLNCGIVLTSSAPGRDPQLAEPVALELAVVGQPGLDLRPQLLLQRPRLPGETDPDQAFPDRHMDPMQPETAAVDAVKRPPVGCRDKLAVQAIGPGVIRAADRAAELAAVGQAQLRPAVPA